VNEQRPVENSFPTTHWSLVGRAGQAAEADRRHALEQLLMRYLPPMRAHLTQAKRLSVDEAEDVLQAFLAEKVLAQNVIGRADSARGRFRSFILTSLNNFLSNVRRDSGAQKRGGGRIESASPIDGVAAPDGSPADTFDVAWAREVLRQAIEAMRVECESGGRTATWEVFRARVLDPVFSDAEPVPYPELVRMFNFESPAQASNALVTANRHFMRVLRRVVGGYEQDAAAIEAELLDLRRIVAGPRAGGD
jgi:DNA-directed RNA polymerase specialized sigma24 family protein